MWFVLSQKVRLISGSTETLFFHRSFECPDKPPCLAPIFFMQQFLQRANLVLEGQYTQLHMMLKVSLLYLLFCYIKFVEHRKHVMILNKSLLHRNLCTREKQMRTIMQICSVYIIIQIQNCMKILFVYEMYQNTNIFKKLFLAGERLMSWYEGWLC